MTIGMTLSLGSQPPMASPSASAAARMRSGPRPSRGTVALAEARTRWTDKLGRVSDHEGQFGERVGKPGGRRHVGPEIVEAPAEVLDEGVRSDDDPGGAVAL